jgi:hypothetical protein
VPKQHEAFGIALGDTPQAVLTLLGEQYKACRLVKAVYRAVPGEAAAHTASLAINPGLTAHDPGTQDLCTYSPAGDGVTDAIDARFLHPSIDAQQPLYFLEVQRSYPDVVSLPRAVARNSFDDVRGALFRLYGRPIDEKRERIVSSAANREVSLGIAGNVKREDYLVRYLWAAAGRLASVEHEDAGCECDGRYVKAVLEITRSPMTIPRNKFYVLSIKVVVEDVSGRRRQDAWNAQWRRSGK